MLDDALASRFETLSRLVRLPPVAQVAVLVVSLTVCVVTVRYLVPNHPANRTEIQRSTPTQTNVDLSLPRQVKT